MHPRTIFISFVVTIALFLLHELFHAIADGLGYGYDNPLGVLYGPHLIGRAVHIGVGALVGLGLAWGLRAAWRRWRARRRMPGP